jgi:Plasmid pRiA4b ORF-3-like protein
MSPANGRRRGKQNRKTVRRTDLTVVRAAAETCDCPACSGEDVGPDQLLGELLEGVTILAECEDALDAELAGAAFVAMSTLAGEELVPAFVQGLIPQVEAQPGSGALAMLLAIGSVASGVHEEVAEAASAAAGRLVTAGVPKPQWAGELAEPVRVGDCVRLSAAQETMSVLVASFQRASSGHAFMVIVDEQDCGAAADILFVGADHLSEALDHIRTSGRADGYDIRTQALDPAELRWYVEEALDARAAHDEESPADAASAMFGQEDDEEAGPPYPVLAVLVRARLAALPEPRMPAGARGNAHANVPAATLLETLASIAGGAGGVPNGGHRGGSDGLRFGGPAPAKLPAKRKKSDGPAPIYQVKVGLRDAKPPIWRRLRVPADVSLARLHDVVQAAFGWEDSHMHVFETPYGDFGRADRELGHRAEAPVTLEQVAGQAGDKIRYTYDFGDGWVHEIAVEKVLDRDPALVYPSCTGGRRAAPPDDCGGIWGYEELVEILTDPQHPEHQDRLEWLGLDHAAQFDPAAFDVDEVNRALANLR